MPELVKCQPFFGRMGKFLSCGPGFRQEEIQPQPAEDQKNTHQLLRDNAFVQKQPGQQTSADGFTQNTHGHCGRGELLQQEIEDKLSADGGDQRQSQERTPGPAGITGEGISPESSSFFSERSFGSAFGIAFSKKRV